MEQTDLGGLRLKAPKTRAGRRTITLPPHTIEMLRELYRAQIELRLQLGLGGRPGPQDWVFSPDADGSGPWAPENLSTAWIKLVKACGLPKVTFHSIRHSHASALIAGGMDVVAVSKRLGHSNPGVTLNVYSHEFNKRQADDKAAAVIEQLFR